MYICSKPMYFFTTSRRWESRMPSSWNFPEANGREDKLVTLGRQNPAAT